MSENVLIVGSGGREHALAWKLAQSELVERVVVAPGNGGTATAGGKIENIAIPETNIDRLIEFARDNNVAMTVIGPESTVDCRHRRSVHRCRAALLWTRRRRGPVGGIEDLFEGADGASRRSHCRLSHVHRSRRGAELRAVGRPRHRHQGFRARCGQGGNRPRVTSRGGAGTTPDHDRP